VFNFFQTFGYYGFAAWIPTLLIAKGIKVTTSFEYSFIIAVTNPVGPLLCTVVADRIERNGRGVWEQLGSASSACCSRIANCRQR
jgi:putative MFS transporter